MSPAKPTIKRVKAKRTASRKVSGAPVRNPSEPAWARAAESTLLQYRLSDLKLEIEQTPLQARIDRLYGELNAKGLQFRPHVWLSSAFFSPDDVPGFAIPFYLAHPRLVRLELARIGRVEGAAEDELMRLIRHETGHAIMNAYRLHKNPAWREVFGRFSAAYMPSYKPDPKSRDYVVNLDGWYGQSHPAEDFCETFAVWLRPRSAWRSTYARSPALAKLEFIDAEMKRISSVRQKIRNKIRLEPLSALRRTLGQFYKLREAESQYEVDVVDAALRSVFVQAPRTQSAAAYLRRVGPRLERAVAELTGKQRYDVSQVIRRMIERSRALRLMVPKRHGVARAVNALVTVEVLKLHRSRRQTYFR